MPRPGGVPHVDLRLGSPSCVSAPRSARTPPACCCSAPVSWARRSRSRSSDSVWRSSPSTATRTPRPPGGAPVARDRHDRPGDAGDAHRAGGARPRHPRDRGHRHRRPGRDRGGRDDRRPDRPRRAADHGPRGHPASGRRGAGPADVAVRVRRHDRRGARRRRHGRAAVRAQAGDVLLRQGPVGPAERRRRRRRLGVRPYRRPGVEPAGDRRGFRRVRLRDHPAHRPARRRHRVLRADRAPPGERRLRRVLAAPAHVRRRAGRRPRRVRPDHRGPRRVGPVRGGAVRPRRRGAVLRGQPAPARHRSGHHGDPAPLGVRAARPRRAGPAGGHRAALPRRVRGDLRRQGDGRPGLRGRRRRTRGRGRGPAAVRQAHRDRAAPDGRRGRPRRRRRHRPGARDPRRRARAPGPPGAMSRAHRAGLPRVTPRAGVAGRGRHHEADHAVPVVRRRRRGGGPVLHRHLPGLGHRHRRALRPGGPRPGGPGPDRGVPDQRPALDRAERRPVFTLSEAISMEVHCESVEEVDRYWDALVDGGVEQPCGWLKDRYGVSWQVIPPGVREWLTSPDAEARSRVARAVYATHGKLDAVALEKAYRG
ncbi:hypothetical protein L7F22_009722 [Adiantum nelumboides]|nr:hypothetical protein [Adiantum nelumboides]